MLTLTHKQIPSDLKQLSHPVTKLNVLGDSFEALMLRPRLAIVGSRKVTPYGRGVTDSLTKSLTEKGIVIISGLALGVDSLAHKACLRAGGQTIAVLPSGFDKIYPPGHNSLAKDIIDNGGALVTEYENGTIPYLGNFLSRNRIIAGLSEGVIVTEAAIRSGSLNTANHALQLGKPVFAVPGNITSPMSAGCNNLIKAGAVPITCVEDILNALGWSDLSTKAKKIVGATPEEQTIIDLIINGLSDGAEMLIRSNLEASAFNQALTMLEITGSIRPTGANHWAL
jgi:DNA processing protein